MHIEGHTDSRGTHAYNVDLSQRRAAAVRTYLIDNGVDASRLTSEGMSFDVPVASNATDSGRAQNRRIEFHIAD